MNVFLAAGRPPGMEQLHQEAQLNLHSLLQGSRERGWRGLGEGDGWVPPWLGDYPETVSSSPTRMSEPLLGPHQAAGVGSWGVPASSSPSPISAPKSLLQVPKQLGPGSRAGATRAPTSLTTAQFSRGPQGPATDLPNWINVASGFCFLPISGPGCHMALARMLLRHQMRSAAQPSPSL